MPYDLEPDALDRDLVFDFFWRFSVFECALKREGFLRAGEAGEALADWRKFEDEIHGEFADLPNFSFQSAVSELIASPPRRQVVREGRLVWADPVRGGRHNRERHVLGLVRTIRNNLFHGGKYPDGLVADVERDKALIQAALRVLEGCYTLHPGIASWRTAA